MCSRIILATFVSALFISPGRVSARLDRFMPRQGGTTEIWRVTDDPAVRYSVNYHNAQCWSPGGRYICYSGGGQVFAYDLHEDREIQVDRGSSPRWGWKHNWLFYIRDRNEVMWLDVDSGKRTRLATGEAAQLGGTDSEDRWLFGGRSTGGRQGMQGFRIAIQPNSKFEMLEGLVGIQWIPNPAHPVVFVRWDYYDDSRRDDWGRFLLSLPTRKWFNLEGGDIRTGSPQIQRCHQSWSGDGTYHLHGGMPMKGRRWDEPYPSNLHFLAAIGSGDISPCGHSGRWITGSSSYGPLQIADLRSGDGRDYLEAALSHIYDSRSYSFSSSSGKHDNDAKGSGDGTKVAFHGTYDLKDGPVTRTTGGGTQDRIPVESTDGFPERGALSLPNNRVIGYERKTPTSFEGLTLGLYNTRSGSPGEGTVVTSFEARLIPEDQRDPSVIPGRFADPSFPDRDSPLIWQRQCDVYIAVVRRPDRPYLRKVGESLKLIPGENHWETFGYNVFRDGMKITREPARPGTEVPLPGPGLYTATAVEWSGLESERSLPLQVRGQAKLSILADKPADFSWTSDRWSVDGKEVSEAEAKRSAHAIKEIVHGYDGVIHREWYERGTIVRRHDLNLEGRPIRRLFYTAGRLARREYHTREGRHRSTELFDGDGYITEQIIYDSEGGEDAHFWHERGVPMKYSGSGRGHTAIQAGPEGPGTYVNKDGVWTKIAGPE